MTTCYVADIGAWTGAAEVTLRLSTHAFTTLPTEVPANVTYRGMINDIGQMDRSIFEGDALSGKPATNAGYVEFTNTGELDTWLNYGFDGRSISVYRLDRDQVFASRQLMFVGTLLGIDASNAWTHIRLRVRDRLTEIDVPFLVDRYAGTVTSPDTSLEGTEDLKDQVKPKIFGTVRNTTPKLVNPFSLLYQVSFSAVTSIAVKVGGQEMTNAGNFITLTDLVAATIPVGQYATCLTAGVFRLSGSAAAPITADVTEAARSIANIALTMLLDAGVTDIDVDSFTAADVFNSAQGGILVDSDETLLDLLGKVLDSLGFAVIPDQFGEFRLVILRDPIGLTSTATFDLNDVGSESSLQILSGQSSEGDGIPAYKFVINYNRNYTVMNVNELAGILTDAQKLPYLEQNRTVLSQDTSVLTAHLLAVELTKDTYLSSDADAAAEATRQLNLFKVRRDRISVSVHDENADAVDLGDCVTVVLDRFGYNAGKKFLVLGKTNEFSKRMVTMSLWG